MYERMLNKQACPSPEEISAAVGAQGRSRMEYLEQALQGRYDLRRELRFPFGNHYGWGYKYSHRSRHLCYCFFEQGAFTVTLQLGDREVPKVEEQLSGLTEKTREYWANRYPCGEQGGWIHYRVLSDEDCEDILALLAVKQKPLKDSAK